MRRVAGALSVMLAAGVVVVGCGDDESSTTTAAAATATELTTSSVDGSATSSTGDSSTSGTTETVNANTAGVNEMAAAFSAAGVPNAEKLAREVEEYRPYTDDDWAHLYQELSKYNIDDATFDKIVSTLEL